jgi:Icc-related predicted phosphoesterase
VAISEHDRYELHKWLIDSAGEQVAETLMAHLPPVGWADVATTRDLDVLGSTLRSDMQELRAEFHDTLRMHLMVILGFNLSLAGAVAALLR